MPALFATCTKCGYRFHYDYDFRVSYCSKCHAGFDWGPKGSNPSQVDSMRGDAGGGSGGSAPILPGEAGHAEYAKAAREEHEASSLPHGQDQKMFEPDFKKGRE